MTTIVILLVIWLAANVAFLGFVVRDDRKDRRP
ncbi:unannotated protein [freshwater metagenome]|uniref:Unannotated protein n=1 Tax=freshwater metagenome TaxID=449393 RepID=A0A6J7FK96_9ZZZZ